MCCDVERKERKGREMEKGVLEEEESANEEAERGEVRRTGEK